MFTLNKPSEKQSIYHVIMLITYKMKQKKTFPRDKLKPVSGPGLKDNVNINLPLKISFGPRLNLLNLHPGNQCRFKV